MFGTCDYSVGAGMAQTHNDETGVSPIGAKTKPLLASENPVSRHRGEDSLSRSLGGRG